MRTGLNESEAVRAALVEAARSRSRGPSLLAEAARLAADARDRAEIAEVNRDLADAEADWPE